MAPLKFGDMTRKDLLESTRADPFDRMVGSFGRTATGGKCGECIHLEQYVELGRVRTYCGIYARSVRRVARWPLEAIGCGKFEAAGGPPAEQPDPAPPYNGLPPYQAGSDTSEAAAVAMAPNAGTIRAEVLKFFRECGERGSTDEEMFGAFRADDQQNTYRPRRCELVEMGFLVDSGRRRLTRSSRNAVVWIVKEAPR